MLGSFTVPNKFDCKASRFHLSFGGMVGVNFTCMIQVDNSMIYNFISGGISKFDCDSLKQARQLYNAHLEDRADWATGRSGRFRLDLFH